MTTVIFHLCFSCHVLEMARICANGVTVSLFLFSCHSTHQYPYLQELLFARLLLVRIFRAFLYLMKFTQFVQYGCGEFHFIFV